jgi:hypothetical protein
MLFCKSAADCLGISFSGALGASGEGEREDFVGEEDAGDGGAAAAGAGWGGGTAESED